MDQRKGNIDPSSKIGCTEAMQNRGRGTLSVKQGSHGQEFLLNSRKSNNELTLSVSISLSVGRSVSRSVCNALNFQLSQAAFASLPLLKQWLTEGEMVNLTD